MPPFHVAAVEVIETHVPGQPVDVETTTLWESRPWHPIADAISQAYLRAFARQTAFQLPESEAVGPDPDLVYGIPF